MYSSLLVNRIAARCPVRCDWIVIGFVTYSQPDASLFTEGRAELPENPWNRLTQGICRELTKFLEKIGKKKDYALVGV